MSVQNQKCPLCGNLSASKIPASEFRVLYNCTECRSFLTKCEEDLTSYNLEILDEKDKVGLRHYLKYTHKDTMVADLSSKAAIQKLLSTIPYPTGILEKFNLVLKHINKKTDFYGEFVPIDIQKEHVLFFCKDIDELVQILEYLKSTKRYINSGNNNNPYVKSISLTPEGMEYVQSLDFNPKSKQCFVAMWFNNETDKAWSESINPAIRKSGYEPVKIDEVEHADDINDKIISEIRRSKFMIVDLTGNRGGVYFEAGFGFGLGLPVIYTCKKDKLDEVHFDLKHRNMILWEEDKYEEFKEALINRIGAIVGLNKTTISGV